MDTYSGASYENAEDYSFGALGNPYSAPSGYHLKWLEKTSSQMSDENEEVFSKLSTTQGRVQESGHEIESAWKEFLSGWLPPQYEVKTRKYIVGEIDSGEYPEETDLVILRPSYPSSLREKSHVLAGGVAAAFSVKSTLRKTSIYESAESCARLARTLALREGTPRKELTRPFVYGVLAHSHEWKAESSTPTYNVSKHLFEADQTLVQSPRASLDLVCVSDLGTWNHIKGVTPVTPLPTALLADIPEEDRQELMEAFSGMQIRTAFVLNPAQQRADILASFLTSLYSRLAIQDGELKALADAFSLMGAESGGRDKSRLWNPEQILTPAVRDLPHDRWEHFTFGSEHATTYGWHVPW